MARRRWDTTFFIPERALNLCVGLFSGYSALDSWLISREWLISQA